jgi:hypothetical protein
MKDGGSVFDEEKIYRDFAEIYRKYIRRNRRYSKPIV